MKFQKNVPRQQYLLLAAAAAHQTEQSSSTSSSRAAESAVWYLPNKVKLEVGKKAASLPRDSYLRMTYSTGGGIKYHTHLVSGQ